MLQAACVISTLSVLTSSVSSFSSEPTSTSTAPSILSSLGDLATVEPIIENAPSAEKSKSTPPAIEDSEEVSKPKKQRLREDLRENQKVFAELVEVVECDDGLLDHKYKCRNCRIMKMTKASAIRHARTCGKKSTRSKRGKSKKIQKCNRCLFTSTNTKLMISHRQVAHKSAIIQKYRCTRPACRSTLSSAMSLKSHIKRHILGRKYACDVCGKRFLQSGTRNRHAKIHHKVIIKWHFFNKQETTCISFTVVLFRLRFWLLSELKLNTQLT